MELIVISENKFKIMLSAPDMRRYELNPEDMAETDDHTRRAFRHLLDDCGEIGRDTRGERLLVQVYSSKEGGCEIFVTKIAQTGCNGAQSDRQAYRLTEGEKALRTRIMEMEGAPPVVPSRDASVGTMTDAVSSMNDVEYTGIRTRSFAFLFDGLGDAIRACRRLDQVGIAGGACYILEGEKVVILNVMLPILCDQRPDASVAFLYEYGREINEANGVLYLREHAMPLAEADAVSLLASF